MTNEVGEETELGGGQPEIAPSTVGGRGGLVADDVAAVSEAVRRLVRRNTAWTRREQLLERVS